VTDPTDIVTRLRAVLHNDRSVELMNREAADIIERLRAESQNAYERTKTLTAERDEARRELCRIESSASGDPNMTSRAVAADCGWDCFKEDGK